MEPLEEITAYGHENIQCSHKTTIELTKESHLTIKGNCILGINCSKACADLNPQLKDKIRNGKKIKVTIEIDDLIEQFYGYGHPRLTLLDEKDIVFRKSNFICNRTILINCNKASNELDKNLINKLKIPGNKIIISFKV